MISYRYWTYLMPLVCTREIPGFWILTAATEQRWTRWLQLVPVAMSYFLATMFGFFPRSLTPSSPCRVPILFWGLSAVFLGKDFANCVLDSKRTRCGQFCEAGKYFYRLVHCQFVRSPNFWFFCVTSICMLLSWSRLLDASFILKSSLIMLSSSISNIALTPTFVSVVLYIHWSPHFSPDRRLFLVLPTIVVTFFAQTLIHYKNEKKPDLALLMHIYRHCHHNNLKKQRKGGPLSFQYGVHYAAHKYRILN